MMKLRSCFSVLILSLALSLTAAADTTAEQEIDYLLNAVGSSNCDFIRNGKTYSSEQAEDHLRLKLRRGSRYAKTADDFINNLATRSSWSGKPYLLQCPGQAEQPVGEWLHQQLAVYRKPAG